MIPKRGFLVRIGHIIIIQILFIFSALALVLFYPRQSASLPDQNKIEQQMSAISSEIKYAYQKADRLSDRHIRETKFDHSLKEIFSNKAVSNLNILFWPGDEKDQIRTIEYIPASHSDDVAIYDESLKGFLNNLVIAHLAGRCNPHLVPLLYESRRMIYLYQFELSAGSSAVLVSVSNHNLVVSSSSQLKYGLLLLFLASALITLLLIYLISKRFSEPIQRLINGFSKTAQGELFYLIDTGGDKEIQVLSQSFNNMSATLYANHKQLHRYNRRLKQASERIKESQQFYSTLIDCSPLSVVTVSAEGKIMTFNKKASDDFGYSRDEVEQTEIDKLFSLPVFESRLSAPETAHQSSEVEVICCRKDLSRFPALMISAPIYDEQNQVTANLLILKDISQSKSYQEMMIRIDRYYTRGEMAGDIAHEINNFLAVLHGNIELMPLMIKRGNNEKISQKLDKMKEAVERIVRFTDGLLDANMGKSEFNTIDANQLVENVTAFLKPQNRFDEIEVKTELGTDLKLVELDIGQIQQLMVNLLNNAAEAIHDSDAEGHLLISTSMTTTNDQPAIRFEVRDNGPGVQKDKVELLFEKRFTTKANGHGIGLVTCKRIVDAHQGKISYHYDNGAVFSVEFPIRQIRDLTTNDNQQIPLEESVSK